MEGAIYGGGGSQSQPGKWDDIVQVDLSIAIEVLQNIMSIPMSAGQSLSRHHLSAPYHEAYGTVT